MMRTKSLIIAEREAKITGLKWGINVFDGYYYVGTSEQLARIGCTVLGITQKQLQHQ